MFHRAHVRCSSCRCAIAIDVVWAGSGRCPRCLQPIALEKVAAPPPRHPPRAPETGPSPR